MSKMKMSINSQVALVLLTQVCVFACFAIVFLLIVFAPATAQTGKSKTKANKQSKKMDENQVKAMIKAAQDGDLQAVKVLLAEDRNLGGASDQTGETPIFAALFRGKQETVDFLLGEKIPLSLFEAAALGKIERVKSILGANPELLNEKGYGKATALHFAAFTGQTEVVKLLLGRKANVNVIAEGIDSVTPLHSAAARQHLEIAELLLRSGANPNAQQKGGFTALHEAAKTGNKELAVLLLKHSADKNIKSDDGSSPLDFARRHDQKGIIEILDKEKN